MSELAARDYRCGHVCIIGRPNVGKSTLLNRLLGTKLSITSSKPQTTRWHILGIKTGTGFQIIYVDTPGVQCRFRGPMYRHMERETAESLLISDVNLLLVADGWRDEDALALDKLGATGLPLVVAINKVDKIQDKTLLLPRIAELEALVAPRSVVPVSARTGDGLTELERVVIGCMPVAQQIYPDDSITDRNKRFLAAEYLREKIVRVLGQDLPYSIAVTVDSFREKQDITVIYAVIWIEKASQKPIVLGKKGELLKTANQLARLDMERMFACKVFLDTRVKIRKDWSSDVNVLKQMGYNC